MKAQTRQAMICSWAQMDRPTNFPAHREGPLIMRLIPCTAYRRLCIAFPRQTADSNDSWNWQRLPAVTMPDMVRA